MTKMITWQRRGTDGHFRCKTCGKDEYTMLIVEQCQECEEAEAAIVREKLIRMGVKECRTCRKEGNWWERLFPRKAKHYVNGRYLCNKHKEGSP